MSPFGSDATAPRRDFNSPHGAWGGVEGLMAGGIWNNLEVIWECDSGYFWIFLDISGFGFCSWIHGSMFFVWLEPGHCKIKAVNTRTKRRRRIDTSKKIKHQA